MLAYARLDNAQFSSNGIQHLAAASVCHNNALRACPGMKFAAAANVSLTLASPLLMQMVKVLNDIGTTSSVNASAYQAVTSHLTRTGIHTCANG